jgi:hypothetical protein
MHAYATDSEERKYIPFFVAALAIAVAYGVSIIATKTGLQLPFWFPSLDTIGLYGLFFWLFDKYIWRWPLLHKLGAVRVPVLAGKWHASAVPVDTEGVSKGKTASSQLRVQIRQRWLSISISGEAAQSNFWSVSGYVEAKGPAVLGYEFVNEPAVAAPVTMQTHRGTVRLVLGEDGTTLKGDYYSGRGRQNLGTFELVRVQRH